VGIKIAVFSLFLPLFSLFSPFFRLSSVPICGQLCFSKVGFWPEKVGFWSFYPHKNCGQSAKKVGMAKNTVNKSGHDF
jgi:hypothetical protein